MSGVCVGAWQNQLLTVKSAQIQVTFNQNQITGQRIIFSDWMDAQTDLILLKVTHGIVLFCHVLANM